MKLSEVDVNPYVRLTVDPENNYKLEVILPIASSPENVDLLENGSFESTPEDGLPSNVNYVVHLSTAAAFSETHYTRLVIDLSPDSGSKGILVRVSDPSAPSFMKGPKADGKTIIQFEDAER